MCRALFECNELCRGRGIREVKADELRDIRTAADPERFRLVGRGAVKAAVGAQLLEDGLQVPLLQHPIW